MGALATLSPTRLSVLPGATAQVTVQVRNTGAVVDEMTFEVLGEPAPWASVEPASLALYPGSTGEVTLTFAPPRDAAIPPTALPFGLRVLSREDAAGSVVEEGVLDVGAFQDLSAELLPRTSRGRRWGRHEVAVDNRGNIPVEVGVLAAEGQDRSELRFDAPSATVGPGQAGFVGVRVRGVKRIWRGSPASLPVRVVVDPGDGQPLLVEGTYSQEPMIPRWLPKALAALLVLAALAVVAWFTLLKPAVKDAAKDQAQETAQKAGAQAGAAAGKKAAGGGATPGGQPSPSPSVRASASAGAGTGATDVNALPGTPFFTRLVATAANQKPQVAFDAATQLSLTDIVFENPQGDTGLLTLSCGTQTLFTPNLGNFRDLDLHQVAPIICGPSAPLVMSVTCQTPGTGAACTPAVSLSGYTRKPSPSPTPGAKASP